jgi:hypothetical protein
MGHLQVLVLGDPAETLALQDNDWRHTRLRHQFLIIQLGGQKTVENFKDSPTFSLPPHP